MSALRLILADQISNSIASLQGLDKASDTVMLCEVMEEACYGRCCKKIIWLNLPQSLISSQDGSVPIIYKCCNMKSL